MTPEEMLEKARQHAWGPINVVPQSTRALTADLWAALADLAKRYEEHHHHKGPEPMIGVADSYKTSGPRTEE